MPVEVLMPALSPTMTEGTLAKWLVKEGEEITSGKVIAEIETDKATMEVEAVDEGKLGKILVKEGSEGVPVNKVIALILEEGEDKKALDSYKPKEPEKPKEEAKDDAGEKGEKKESSGNGAAPAAAPVARAETKAPEAPIRQSASAAGASMSGDRAKASPLAKRIAKEQSIDLSRVMGSGPKGRIVKSDVEEALLRGGAGGGAVRRHPTEFTKAPHSSMRKVIANRLLESKQTVPHFYLTIECQIDALLEVRAQLNAQAMLRADDKGKPPYKISVNDMIIKASACALRDKPDCNSSWYDDAIVYYNNIDVSVAVATPDGLITPIIRNADQKALPQISNEMKELAGRARANKLKPEEFQGGGFSISNLGMYGIKDFAAIVNPPQSCILAVGAGEEKVISKGGNFEVVNVMNVTLSVDHRAVDGALGAEWLQAFKRYIEQPVLMFV